MLSFLHLNLLYLLDFSCTLDFLNQICVAIDHSDRCEVRQFRAAKMYSSDYVPNWNIVFISRFAKVGFYRRTAYIIGETESNIAKEVTRHLIEYP